ncbi:WXG100 family type VII secretion target [Mycolicibacterium celeriflavum]|uniref:Uncharacterized protein n=1 Tax=Mycolicibacterium celeriflavum TaxID=1249101 RepID=A0A1X0BQ75_MYCCF|nr:WXG100 family type VII secretion target [Mycolicibacterium celeriflavum]MCV7240402.1 WXG100 family type VII secretion target [Mycolicibacterium celeriflavum]ORA45196.1 hypothetical protein BST21_17895 [Mycolicibacterium celeriflavum]BBY44143.1 hypothetical protein MCEL_24380 [Mycolicibacterium celeriflavum]
MLPSRPTLRGWSPESLSASAAAIQTRAQTVADAVSGIDAACERMPETRAWSGKSHEAASAMFGRAEREASKFSEYANGVASALRSGADSIGSARSTLLAKADELDAGPLNVSDQWVVLVDPVYMSEEEMAKLQSLALQEQATVNTMLIAVGDADNATADAVVAAGKDFGFVEPGPPSELGDILLPTAQRPPNEVPDPLTPVGVVAQEAIRSADQQQNVREVIESTNKYGEEVTTVIKQDGSKAVTTRMDPFEWPSKQNFYQMEEFDKDGNFVARTSSWHDMGNDCDYTSITYADGSNMTMSMDPTGHRTAGFTTADGRHSAVPVELIDNISMGTGAAMSGLEKHIARGGSLPMLTAESVDNIGKTMKFGGPALAAATTVFDMVMADSDKERCIALVAGAAGGGGGWAMAEAGAALGAFGGIAAPVTVPVGAFAFGLFGAFGGAKMGKFIGEVVCPY